MGTLDRRSFSISMEPFHSQCGKLYPLRENGGAVHCREIEILKRFYESQLAVKDCVIKKLQDIIDEQEARIFNIERHSAGLSELSPRVKDPLKGLVELCSRFEQVSEEKNKLELRLSQELHLREDLEKQFKDLSSLSNQNCTEKGIRAEKGQEILRTEWKKTEAEVENLKKELLIAQESNSTLKEQLEQTGKAKDFECQENSRKLDRLKRKLEEIRVENANLNKQLDAATSKFSPVQALLCQEGRITQPQNDTELKELKSRLNLCLTRLDASERHLSQTKELLEQEKRNTKDAVQNCKEVWGREREKLVERIQRLEFQLKRKQFGESEMQKLAEGVATLRKGHTELGFWIQQTQMEFGTAFSQLQKALIGRVGSSFSALTARYKAEMRLRKHYFNQLVELKGNIRVLCRVRPLIRLDLDQESSVEFDETDDGVLHMKNGAGRLQKFVVDKVFRPSHSQTDVFQEVRPLISSCIDGYSVCIFAYGQTGSGKTYTMEGSKDDPGIGVRALGALFTEADGKAPDWTYAISVSMLEIYNENIRDLLWTEGIGSDRKLEVKMNGSGGLHVPGLTHHTVLTVEDVAKIFETGQKNRATAATNLNERSSRSHALLSVRVQGRNVAANSSTSAVLNLVDLAGSERLSKSGVNGDQLKETQSINRSLSDLELVISALKNKRTYIPFRNSKLTYLLQDCLSGDSKTVLVVQVAPSGSHRSESICSLSFAQRARAVEMGTIAPRQESNNCQVETNRLLRTGSVRIPRKKSAPYRRQQTMRSE